MHEVVMMYTPIPKQCGVGMRGGSEEVWDVVDEPKCTLSEPIQAPLNYNQTNVVWRSLMYPLEPLAHSPSVLTSM